MDLSQFDTPERRAERARLRAEGASLRQDGRYLAEFLAAGVVATTELHRHVAASVAFNAKVEAYNAPVRAAIEQERRRAAVARQTRANAAEVAAVRNARCESCFATHAGECA